jgi:hypothetical protein
MTMWIVAMAMFMCFCFIGRDQLRHHGTQLAYQRHEHVADAAYNMGILHYGHLGRIVLSRAFFRCVAADVRPEYGHLVLPE